MIKPDVFKALEDEHEYQNKTWPNSKKLSLEGEFVLLEKYMDDFRRQYASSDDAPGFTVPAECVCSMRKMATILVRALSNHGVITRAQETAAKKK